MVGANLSVQFVFRRYKETFVTSGEVGHWIVISELWVHYTNGEIIPTRCNNCVYSSQWLYSTCFGWQFHPSSGVGIISPLSMMHGTTNIKFITLFSYVTDVVEKVALEKISTPSFFSFVPVIISKMHDSHPSPWWNPARRRTLIPHRL